jgi:glycosyltransferase involved in cell wall biosynthesis
MIILSVLSTAYPRPKFFPFFEMSVDSLIKMSVTRFHANSMAAKRALTSERGFKPEKIVCIYTAIDTSLIEAKTKFGADDCINIGMLSAVLPSKGHSYLLEAAKIVRDRCGKKKVKYLIAGDGPYRKELEGLARSSGVAELFEFCGYRPGPASRILSGMDIFVFPSLQESFPYAVLEAMASGLPIIASNVGGIPEQIEDRETGLLVPPSDSRAIAESIISLLDNPGLMLKYGHSARNRVKEFFDIEVFRKKMKELYS